MTRARRSDEVLIVRLAALGDLIMTSALVTRLRTERPRVRVTWLCGRRGAPLVRLFDGVDDVIEVDEAALFLGGMAERTRAMARVWRRLWKRRFTDVVVAHADPRFRLLALPCVGARVRMLRRAAGKMNPIPGRFFGDEYVRLLDDDAAVPTMTAYDVADVRPKLPPLADRLLPDPSRPFVALVPGGARNVLRDSPLRRWPVERYARLAEHLVGDGVDVALIGDDGDRWASEHFAAIPAIDLIGRLSLEQALCVLARAALVVSHDTGPLHLARAVRAPTIALFGPTMPRQMIGASRAGLDVVWGGDQLPCRPCYDGREFPRCTNNLCMQDIAVPAVLALARARLAHAARPSLHAIA